MGIIDSIKSLKPKNYRTYTLYDFSTLVKFKIFVFELDGKYVDTLPAQINPPSINYKKRKTVAEKIVLLDKGGTREDISENTITIEFDFNIVDEYEARTAGGKLPIDLNIDEITIISALKKYSTSKYISMLKWGAFEHVAYIKNVECTYSSYSPYGEALKATANVTFSLEDENNKFGSGIKSLMLEKVKAQSRIDNGLVRANIVASYAASEFIPSIVSAVRGQ